MARIIMAKAYDTDSYNETQNVKNEAMTRTRIPTIPVYAIPDTCSYDYCNEHPTHTLAGKGLCPTHLMRMMQDSAVVKVSPF